MLRQKKRMYIFGLTINNISSQSNLDNIETTTGNTLLIQSLSQLQGLDNTDLIQDYVLVIDPITNQQSLGLVFFDTIPDLGNFLVTFRPDDIGMSYAIDIIQITFGE